MSKTILPSGLRIVTEEVSTSRSAAVGIWANVGSRDEVKSVAGASHFLEHLLFKGTKRRTALEISSSIEAVGGEMNAFTGQEYTCFYARVIDNDLPLAVDVVTDLITSSNFTAEDVDSERTVVLSEIAVRDDDPSDYIHELYLDTVYGDSPIGRSILGTVDSINKMPRNSIYNYYKKHYQPENLVVSVAGNVKHKKVVKLVEEALARDNFLDAPPKKHQTRIATPVKTPGLGKVGIIDRKTEQAHILYGFPGLARNDERRFALSVLSSAVGGGMASRLFQEIREKRGLAYTTYSYPQQFAGTGTLAFYAGCKVEKAEEVIKLMREISESVAQHGLTAEEISRAKGAVTGGLILGQEDTGSRMSRIGKSELVYGEIMSFDDILAKVRSVTPEQVHQLARDLFTAPATLALVGPFRSSAKFEKVIS
ncbi:MAG: pitrilysin family protein [Actinobacteria bacterium]|nr:pitrilysin family protein [Actinomycetota bacterium]